MSNTSGRRCLTKERASAKFSATPETTTTELGDGIPERDRRIGLFCDDQDPAEPELKRALTQRQRECESQTTGRDRASGPGLGPRSYPIVLLPTPPTRKLHRRGVSSPL